MEEAVEKVVRFKEIQHVSFADLLTLPEARVHSCIMANLVRLGLEAVRCGELVGLSEWHWHGPWQGSSLKARSAVIALQLRFQVRPNIENIRTCLSRY